MERFRVALATIKRQPERAAEVLGEGVRNHPEIFIPGIAYFIKEALGGVVIAPKNIPDKP